MEVKDKVVTVEGLKGAYDDLNGKISSNDTDITALQESVTQLNSDLNDKLSLKIYTASYNVSANSNGSIDVAIDDLSSSGYAIASVLIVSGSNYVTANVKAMTSSSVSIALRNNYTSSVNSTLSIRVLRIKD